MGEKERFATIGTWVEVFQKEGVRLSRTTIHDRLKQASVIGMTGRSRIGKLLRNSYFSESDVRRVCGDLLIPMPEAGGDDLIEVSGKVYGTVYGIAKILNISVTGIFTRIKHHSLKPIKGRSRQNNVRDYFSLSEMQRLCTELSQELPSADENGLLKIGDTVYGTIASLSRVLGFSEAVVRSRIKKSTLAPFRGKGHVGQILDFYPLPVVRQLCSDLAQDLPQADKTGSFTLDGKVYSTINGLSKVLKIDASTISSRLQNSEVRPIRGRDHFHRITDFYSALEARQLCQNLLEDIPCANNDGFIEFDGVIYGTPRSLSRLLDIGESAISRRKSKAKSSIQGKLKGGQVRTFYLASEMREICADLHVNKIRRR